MIFRTILRATRYSTTSKMARQDGLSLKSIVEKLNNFADLKLAEPWDNVGLLIEPQKTPEIRTVYITNDLTELVMEEAVANRANLIISYHPPIFTPLKKITQATWKERIVSRCLESGIAVYSPHTAWDAVHGGVTDWLARGFVGEATDVTPITPIPGSEQHGAGRFVTLKNPLPLQQCVEIIKKHTALPHVRLAQRAIPPIPDQQVRKIAFVCGSGASLLRGVEADLYVTGEMLHHDILEANHNGVSVVLLNHSDSERGFLREMAVQLEKMLPGVTVSIAQGDKDPIEYV